MQVVYERCCGLDVHKRTVVASLKYPDATGAKQRERRTFGTTTQELGQLRDWLKAAGCTHVAMESTGVYWKPVYNLLEGHFELLVVNAHHIKNVPGRKTDQLDAEWIADLLQHGLLRGSFIPSAWQRALRELTRYRRSVVEEHARTINRLHKVLEEANVKLASVVSDITGVSARAMVEALLAGETDPQRLADLARGRLRAKRPQLQQALEGLVKDHHRFLLAEHLSHLDDLDAAIVRVSDQIAQQLRPYEADLERLDTIPGVNRRTAEILLAEIGPDMSRFPTAEQLASWAGMCPGNHESAGKRLSGKTRKGSSWLRQALIEAAQAAAHSKKTYLAAQYRRIAARRGKKKAAVAVGHSILVIVYELLTHQTTYEDLGPNYFDERDRQAVERRLVRRLKQLGYEVTLAPASPESTAA
jgi:transposase